MFEPKQALVRIGELSRRTGVRPDAIRAWERRYGLLDPARSSGGYRLYTAADELVLRTMRDLTAQGISAAEAAGLARDAVDPGAAPRQGEAALDPSAQARRLRVALEAFDESTANVVIDQALAGLSLDSFVEDVVLAAMAEIGTRWEQGKTSVAQEHFASNLVRGRLLGLGRGWGAGSGPLALLACVPGELHDHGLLCFGLCLSERGWRVAYLGPDTPVNTLEESVFYLRPQALILAASQPRTLKEAASRLAPLAEKVPVMIGGAGTAEDPGIEGFTMLRGTPAEEAEALATRVARE